MEKKTKKSLLHFNFSRVDYKAKTILLAQELGYEADCQNLIETIVFTSARAQDLLGKMTLSNLLPEFTIVAKLHKLNLNRQKDFNVVTAEVLNAMEWN